MLIHLLSRLNYSGGRAAATASRPTTCAAPVAHSPGMRSPAVRTNPETGKEEENLENRRQVIAKIALRKMIHIVYGKGLSSKYYNVHR